MTMKVDPWSIACVVIARDAALVIVTMVSQGCWGVRDEQGGGGGRSRKLTVWRASANGALIRPARCCQDNALFTPPTSLERWQETLMTSDGRGWVMV
jgi:hypothetical protein